MQIAELYCHGFMDKEVAVKINKPVWTVRTHKKHIYSKLGISTLQELILYMVSRFVGSDFVVSDIRENGLNAILNVK